MGQMSLIKIQDVLATVTQMGMDTDAIIYFVEADATYKAILSNVFARIDTGQIIGVTSTIALTETLVRPIRNKDTAQQQKMRDLLLNSRNMVSVPVDSAIAGIAADLRARYNMRTPDALHAATAINSGCDAFLTNNGSDFRRVSELNVLILSELEL